MDRQLERYWNGQGRLKRRRQWFHETVFYADYETREDCQSIALSDSLILRGDGVVLINDVAYHQDDPIEVEFQPGWHAFRRLGQSSLGKDLFNGAGEILVITGPSQQVLRYCYQSQLLRNCCVWLRCIPRNCSHVEFDSQDQKIGTGGDLGASFLIAPIRQLIEAAIYSFLPTVVIVAIAQRLAKMWQRLLQKYDELWSR